MCSLIKDWPLKCILSFIFFILKEASEDCCPSNETVRKWHNSVSNGSTDAEVAPRSGRPTVACDEDPIELVDKIVEDYRRLTSEELSSKVCVISFTVHNILWNRLHKRKLAAKRVPHVLTEEQKGNRVRLESPTLSLQLATLSV